MRTEVILSGFGGQGLILAGILLGEAAVVREGIWATQNQEYGIAARGGECRSEVVLDRDKPICFAEITAPHLVLSMSQAAFNKCAPLVRSGGIVLADTVFVTDFRALEGRDCRVVKVPLTKICKEATGKTMLANVTALGAISKLLPLVSPENMMEEILERVPKGTEALNQRAFEAGMAAV